MVKKKVKRIVIASAAVVVVAAGGITGFHFLRASGSSGSTTTFRELTVEKGEISTSVSGSGSVSDATQISLTATNAGTIESLSVKQGDTVKVGQTIAHVSGTNSAQTVLQKENALTQAQNELAQAQDSRSSLYIKTPVAGKVKSVLPEAGDSLSDIRSLGSLAVISTERKMTVSFSPSASLAVNDSVKVTDGKKSYTGTVTSAGSGSGQGAGQGGGSTVVSIPTDDPGVGDSVTIYSGSKAVGTGTLALAKSIEIQNSGSGTVSNIYVKENQSVSKGANLFKLSGDSVESQISMKEQAVTTAQADLDTARANAAKDTITAPVNGVIAELDVKEGDSVTNGGAIATLIDPNDMQTVLSVDELDISSVAVGQKATITLDAVSGKTFSGAVTQVDPIGTSSNGVATYNVTVAIENPDGIKVGMTANAEIITQSKSDTLVVSAGAVLEKSGTSAYVLPAKALAGKTLSDVTTRELVQQYGRKVTTGIATENQVEIVSGLTEGESIAIPVTVNQALLKTLNGTSSSANSFGFGGGMGGGMGGGFGGMGGGTGGANRSRTRTGNTVAAGNAANNNTTNNNAANNNAANNNAGTAGGTR